MKQFLTAALFFGLSVGAKASDEPGAPAISRPATPAQLAPGKASGTFHFTSAAYVGFSRKAAFPVDLLIEDYAGQEVFRLSLSESKYTTYSCDLRPGSYRIRYRMRNGKKDYHEPAAESFFIAEDGRRGFLQGSRLEFTDIAADGAPPKPFIVFSRKLTLAAPGDKEEIAGDTVTFRWKPIDGIRNYRLTLWPIQHPDHPDSGYSSEMAQTDTPRPYLTVKLNDLDAPLDLRPGRVYGWNVADADNENQTAGRVARSGGFVFFTRGGKALVQEDKPRDFMRDEQIEASMGMAVQQPYQPSDGSPVSLRIVGIGRDGAALKAGLHPGDEIHSANGQGVATLHELHSIIAQLPKGAPLTLGVETDDRASNKRISKNVILIGAE